MKKKATSNTPAELKVTKNYAMLKLKVMQKRDFQPFGAVSALTLGGGGLGQVWGETTREEAVATVNLAIEKGITHLDVAPMYGKGEAEKVVGYMSNYRRPEAARDNQSPAEECAGQASPYDIEKVLLTGKVTESKNQTSH